ncbi:hypothetical protein ACFPM0_23180 [Pseudonocardia sulfidoxydans]|uniref:hypothetical protein n=1 Tax=Pseudonocardia sulfidoxydans TaxID=54011 RepID=UPI0036077A91
MPVLGVLSSVERVWVSSGRRRAPAELIAHAEGSSTTAVSRKASRVATARTL